MGLAGCTSFFCGIGMSCFRLKREKMRTEMGKDTCMHVVLQKMELRTIFGFKPSFERGNIGSESANRND